MGAVGHPMAAEQSAKTALLKSIEVNEPDGQILSYRYQGAPSDVRLQGTSRARDARIKLKIGSRPGFVELDINRGAITGLKPAYLIGKDFLTYVLWAVSVDGRAANLGEITFDGPNAVSVNVTTPYQTFWLMVTAEPDYAVTDPSSYVVLYSVGQSGADAPQEKRALRIGGKLFYYTHYTDYDSSPHDKELAPNELLQARKAVELASRAGGFADDQRGSNTLKEEEQSGYALTLAKEFLGRAETAYKNDPKGSDVVQYSRTAAQIAENGRAVALGAVGGVVVGRLEHELQVLQSELNKLRAEAAKPSAVKESLPVANTVADFPPVPKPETKETIAEVKTGGFANTVKRLATQPIAWFGVIGWAVVVLLLFRRPSV